MIELQERPDPDELLARTREATSRAARGKLKIFFGFAPGVGKTYRMLQVAHDLKTRAGRDVVVGVVEDHQRRETAALVERLERLGRRTFEYRGRALEEFDLDAALARRPEVLLVDELAHTNVPGSRHPKRWQDVEELLRAGIDVLSTMNVQHTDSLNDVIHQITGVRVRETVPDAFLDAADAIELVDVAPEELLRRLAEGKVYLGDQAKRASEHFFQRGNLLALRELALRRTAQHVDADVRAYREEHGVQNTWPSGERILVCVSPAPSSLRLIRAAARMAGGLRCPWVAVYVESIARGPQNDASRARLDSHLRAAESLGGTVVRLTGDRVSASILRYASRSNVTRIVLGKPTHSRLRDWLNGSLLDDIVRGSDDIEVHVIRGEEAAEPSISPAVSRRKPPAIARHYFAASAAIVGATGLALALRELLNLPDVEMLFLLAVMGSALRFGRGPALVAACLAVAGYDFFFVPPFFTFSVDDRRYVLTFAMMFAVGLLLSELADRLRRQEREAHEREERTASLFALTRELAGAETPEAIASSAATNASSAFDARALVACAKDDGRLELNARDAGLDEDSVRAVTWAFEHDDIAGHGTDTLPSCSALAVPLRVGASRRGVLVLVPRAAAPLAHEQRAFLDVYARQIALALERTHLAGAARSAALRARTEEMRSSLLAAVSHDLRTPLASITGSATALRASGAALAEDTKRELLDSVVEQADRMERLVTNLLDMTRLEGEVTLHREWFPIDEMIGSALTALEARLGTRVVTIAVAPELSLLFVDAILFQQLMVNLLENATKHTPPNTPVEVDVRSDGKTVVLAVRDRGPGIPVGALEAVFEKFVRAAPSNTAGAGLGLAICKGIASAHGGTITARNRLDGGASFEVSLPLGNPPAVAD